MSDIKYRTLQNIIVGDLRDIIKYIDSFPPGTGVSKDYVDTQDQDVLSTADERLAAVKSKLEETINTLSTLTTKEFETVYTAINSEATTREGVDNKLQTSINSKQDELTSENAGDNITITKESGKVKISSTGTGGGVSKDYVDEQDAKLEKKIAWKQDFLSADNAGPGITITKDESEFITISTTASGLYRHDIFFKDEAHQFLAFNFISTESKPYTNDRTADEANEAISKALWNLGFMNTGCMLQATGTKNNGDSFSCVYGTEEGRVWYHRDNDKEWANGHWNQVFDITTRIA